MITLDGTIEQQKDLDYLCQDRCLTTVEPFTSSDCYGNATVIKDAAGIPQNQLLSVIIPHGVYLGPIWPVELGHEIRRVYCWQDGQAQEYKNSDMDVLLGAAPLCYAVRTLKNADQLPLHRTGTIVFPSHSTHHIEAIQDYETFANELEALPEHYKPITICIYWKDYNDGKHIAFKNRGFSIVSAGHMYDPEFIYRWIQLVISHKYAISSEIGSALLYATYLGLDSFILDGHNVEFVTDGIEHSEYIDGQKNTQLFALMRDKFKSRKDLKGKREIVQKLLQSHMMTSPEGLRSVFYE